LTLSSRRPVGSSISIRGFLAGTVRKKLKLSLISEKRDGRRTYRIGSGRAAKTTKASAARSARS